MRRDGLLQSENHVLTGVLYYTFGILLMAVMGASAKALTADYSVVQIIFFNNAIALLCVLIPMSSGGYGQLLSSHWKLLVTRATIASGTIYCYFLGLQHLAWADVAAIFAVAPLITTVLSGWLLKEVIGRSRWLAVAAGFAGALVIIRPATLDHDTALFLPLGAALCYALALIYAKMLIKTESNLVILAYTYGSIAFASLLLLPMFWKAVAPHDFLIFLLMGSFGALGNFFYIKGCRYTPIHVLAPFDYTALIWASLLGFVIWHEVPTVWTWFGAILIVAGGLYILRKQRADDR